MLGGLPANWHELQQVEKHVVMPDSLRAVPPVLKLMMMMMIMWSGCRRQPIGYGNNNTSANWSRAVQRV